MPNKSRIRCVAMGQRIKPMRDHFILLKRPTDITTEEHDLMGPWFDAFPSLSLTDDGGEKPGNSTHPIES